MRRQALNDEVIKHILDLIDENEYTQRELARRYGVSDATISRYNRVKRLQFKSDDNAKLIAKLNNDILNLKLRFGLDTSEELATPDSFCTITLGIRANKNKFIKIEGFYSASHIDCVKFINRHPECYMYTLVSNPSLGESCDGIPQFIRSKAKKNVTGYIIITENLGKITAENQIKIVALNFC